jgi:hypothetical protein
MARRKRSEGTGDIAPAEYPALTPALRAAVIASELLMFGLSQIEALPRTTQLLVLADLERRLWKNTGRGVLMEGLKQWLMD